MDLPPLNRPSSDTQEQDPMTRYMQHDQHPHDEPTVDVESVEVDGVTYSQKAHSISRTDQNKNSGPAMNQDYIALAKIYKITRKYSDHVYNGLCILCKKRECSMVFFPCEHRCVCDGCVEQERICSDLVYANRNNELDAALANGGVADGSSDVGQCNCPLCGEIIKRMLPHEGGDERSKYWEWVLAVKPPLPRGFIKRFSYSADIIQDVCVNEEYRIVAPGSLEATSERIQDNLPNPSGLLVEMLDGISQINSTKLKKYRRRRKQKNIDYGVSAADGPANDEECIIT